MDLSILLQSFKEIGENKSFDFPQELLQRLISALPSDVDTDRFHRNITRSRTSSSTTAAGAAGTILMESDRRYIRKVAGTFRDVNTIFDILNDRSMAIDRGTAGGVSVKINSNIGTKFERLVPAIPILQSKVDDFI